MLDKLKQYISDHQLLRNEDKVLLAVSGGVDSVVMTHLFSKLGALAGIAHCNFKLRGDDADKDQLFVEGLANQLNLPFHTIDFDTNTYAKENKLSIQMAARELRFNWFDSICDEFNYQKIAIASNLNDSVETCLINLTKGTGLKGLHGILPIQKNIIHPMLFATKEEIISFSKENNIAFREDASNASDKYIRNKIRLNVIPQLKEINPQVERSFEEFFTRINNYEAFIEKMVNNIIKKVVKKDGNETYVDLEKIDNDELNVFLYEYLSRFDFNGDQIDQIANTLQSGKTFYSNKFRVITNRDELIISPNIKNSPAQTVLINVNDHSIDHPIHLTLDKDRPNIERGEKIACLDLDKLVFPLTLRKWESGDNFQPLGMKGIKKLSDFFTDIKLSILEKENTFVITSNDRIVWVVGHRIDDRYKVSENSKQQLTIRLK